MELVDANLVQRRTIDGRALAAGPASPGHESDYGQPPAVQWRQWWNWPERQRQREALRALADDKHLLNDLGLTRQQALEEAARPFWR